MVETIFLKKHFAEEENKLNDAQYIPLSLSESWQEEGDDLASSSDPLLPERLYLCPPFPALPRGLGLGGGFSDWSDDSESLRSVSREERRRECRRPGSGGESCGLPERRAGGKSRRGGRGSGLQENTHLSTKMGFVIHTHCKSRRHVRRIEE